MSADGDALLAEVKEMLPFLQSEAARHDQLAEFPAESFERLRQAHLLRASLPEALGGFGLGYGADGASALL
jgi:alkylation response protein AidB-like acyl-CoA dehydrogenase